MSESPFAVIIMLVYVFHYFDVTMLVQLLYLFLTLELLPPFSFHKIEVSNWEYVSFIHAHENRK